PDAVAAARARTGSVGAHYRSDAPDAGIPVLSAADDTTTSEAVRAMRATGAIVAAPRPARSSAAAARDDAASAPLTQEVLAC
uniref:hypothetical protein n=1 Tax=uncultured Microbacterium sp. TaxID=191216 RepID=UPI0028D7E3BA